LLLALAAFVYVRFDAYWPRLRQAVASVSPWHGSSGKTASTDAGAVNAQARGPAQGTVKWSPDSSLIALDCPRGIAGACCEALDRASPGLCGEATSLMSRANWKGVLDKRAASGFLRFEARAVPEEASRRLALSGLAGRDDRGGFILRRRASDLAWCEGSRGCLGDRPSPASPLSDAKLERGTGGAGTWVSPSPWVRAALPGRIAAVDSVEGGVIVRLYHGYELYTTYGPLQPAPGVRPGAIVKTGSHLGDAPARGALHALAVRVRQAGRLLDPAAFWGMSGARLSDAGAVPAEDDTTDAAAGSLEGSP
jgi:hypothetical protein